MSIKGARLKDAMELELLVMAWHESAHAIVALQNYLQVYYVSVRNDDEKDGRTDFYIPLDIKDQELKHTLFMAELQTLYAGLTAERMLYRDLCGSIKYPRHLQVGLSYDIKLASNLIRRHELAPAGKETAEFKKNIQHKVGKILLEHWGSVKLIAHTLHKKRKIPSFEELRLILTRKSNEKEFWREKFSKINIIYGKNQDIILPEEDIKALLLGK
jgi:hypothetical protein